MLARIEKKLDDIDFDQEINKIFNKIEKEAVIKRPKPSSDSTSD